MDRNGKLIYMDNGATSFPKPPAVLEAMERYTLEIGGSPGRSGHRLSQKAARIVFECREALAALIGAKDSRRVVFSMNATEALNIALLGTLKNGDRVVTTSMEHNSVMRPLRHLAGKGDIDLQVLPCDSAGRLDPGLLEEALKGRPRLVAVNHASNVTGTIAPLARIGGMTRAAGSLLLVDAAQSAGVVSIDVERDCIDLLAFTGHKALLGPQGTGGLWVREGVELDPVYRGGTGSNSELEEQPDFFPDCLESGTLNAVGLAGLRASLTFLAERGVERIGAKEKALARRLIEGLDGPPGLTLYGPGADEERTAVVSFTIAGMVPSEVGFLLDDAFGILTRVGLHCSPGAHRTIGSWPTGTVRLSPGFFTSEEEIDRVIEACRYIAARKGGGR